MTPSFLRWLLMSLGSTCIAVACADHLNYPGAIAWAADAVIFALVALRRARD